MNTPLIKKMLIKPGYQVLVLNEPAGYAEKIDPAERCTDPERVCDVIWLFVRSKAEIDHWFSRAIQQLKPGGVLWISYPKRTAPGVVTDINRDTGWDTLRAAGWQGVTQIAIDEVWSALRFRPAAEVKRKP